MKTKAGKIVTRVLIGIVILLAVAAVAVFLLFQHYYSKSGYVKDEDIIEQQKEAQKKKTNSDADETEEVATLSSEDEQEVLEEQEQVEIQEVSTSGVYNILLIGSDRRDTGWFGNSDSMILMSINHNAKRITLISFMRDLYANIEGEGVRKLNHAYAVGGGPLLCSTITTNYGVHIDNYATVDFTSMAAIVDILGGLDVELYQEEATYLNGEHGYSLVAGVNHLNGEQAVSYARIRYIGQYDYERTARQRRILSLIFDKAKSMDVLTLNEMANTILPYITHNIDQGQLVTLMTQLPSMVGYELAQDRVPYDGLYSNMGEILVPDFQTTIDRLQQTIYQ